MSKKTIQQKFEEFHDDNPAVFKLIVEQAKRAMRSGKKKFGIKQIIEWIRWETFIKTTDSNQGELFTDGEKQPANFKINNSYTSRYARKLIQQYPEMESYIETRDIRAL